MGLFGLHLPKKVDNVFGAVGRQVNPFDNGATAANSHPVGVAPQVTQAISNAKYGVLANNPRLQQSFLKQAQPQSFGITDKLGSVIPSFNEAVTKVVAQPVLRTIPQIAATVLNRPTYTPGSGVEKAVFGDRPVQSIQQGVRTNYQQHHNPALAALYGAGQVGSVLPTAGVAAKGGKIIVREAAPVVNAVVDTRAPLNEIGAVGKNVKLPSPAGEKVPTISVRTAKQGTVNAGQGITKLPTELPTQTGGLQRTFLSTSGELSRMGEAGQMLANKLKAARDTSEVGQATFLKQIPTVAKLKQGEFQQFVNSLDQLSRGKTPQLSPKLTQAVNEWSQAIPKVHQAVSATGKEVGNLGKYYFPRNYSELLKNQASVNRTANQLVASGQAPDIATALQQLRFMQRQYSTKFGHFENARQFDLPGYDKSKNALINYIGGAYNTIGHAQQFGPKDEIANQLIAQLGSQGHDVERASKLLKVATGTEQYNQPGIEKTSNAVRAFNRTTKLGLSAILNAGQTVNTATAGGIGRTGGDLAKYLLRNKSARDFVDSTGVNAESVLSNLREQTGISGKITGKLTAPGFNAVERVNRGTAALVGRDVANMLAERAVKGDASALENLTKNFGITPKGAQLTRDEQIQAARNFVERTQFKVDPQDLPAWANSPLGKLAAQFRTFSYKQQKFIWDEVVKQAGRGNIVPLTRMLTVGAGVGYLTSTARGALRGQTSTQVKGNQDNPTTSGIGRYLDALNNVGAGGLASSAIFPIQNIKSQRFPQYLASSTLGPSAGLALQTATNVSQASAGKPSSLSRQGLSAIPIAGPFIANKTMPYKPSTKVTASTESASKRAKEALNSSDKTFSFNGKDMSAKDFAALSSSDQKLAAQNDPNARALYDQLTALRKGLTPGKLYASDLPADQAKVLDRFARLTPVGKDKVLAREKDAEFKQAYAKYQNDKLSGNLTDSEDIRAQDTLAKKYIGSKYNKNTRDIYSLAKKDIERYVIEHPDQAKALIAYDKELYDNGLISSSKFKNGFGSGGSSKGINPSTYAKAISVKGPPKLARAVSVKKVVARARGTSGGRIKVSVKKAAA